MLFIKCFNTETSKGIFVRKIKRNSIVNEHALHSEDSLMHYTWRTSNYLFELFLTLLGGPENSWLVGCFGFNGPLRQYFSLYRAVSQRERDRRERIDESKNVQTTPTRTYCKRV